MSGLIDVMAKAPGKLGTKGMLQKASCKGQGKDRSVKRASVKGSSRPELCLPFALHTLADAKNLYQPEHRPGHMYIIPIFALLDHGHFGLKGHTTKGKHKADM